MATVGVLLSSDGNSYSLTGVYPFLKRATNCICRLLIDISLRAFPERRLFAQ